MDFLLESALSNALLATALAFVAAGVGTLLRRPLVAYGLWIVVLLKLITPPVVMVPVFTLASMPSTRSTNASPVPSPESARSRAPEATKSLDVGGLLDREPSPGGAAREDPGEAVPGSVSFEDIAVAEAGSIRAILSLAELEDAPRAVQPSEPPDLAVAVAASAPAPPDASISPHVWGVAVMRAAIWIWLAGTALYLIRAATRIVRFRRFLLFGAPAPRLLQERTRGLATRLGIERCPHVLLLPGNISPMLWAAGGRATIVLPRTLLSDLDDDQLDTLLTHELAHLRRGDHRVRLLELVATSLYWWHPVVWWARSRLREAEEQACDAWVVTALPAAAEAYARALLKTADFLSRARPALPPAGSGVGHFFSLKRRLTMIMDGTAPKRVSVAGRLVVVAFAALLLPLAVTGAAPGDVEGAAEGSANSPAFGAAGGAGAEANDGAPFGDAGGILAGLLQSEDKPEDKPGREGTETKEKEVQKQNEAQKQSENEIRKQNEAQKQNEKNIQKQIDKETQKQKRAQKQNEKQIQKQIDKEIQKQKDEKQRQKQITGKGERRYEHPEGAEIEQMTLLIGRLLVDGRHEEAEKLARSVRQHREERREAEREKGRRAPLEDESKERRDAKRERGTAHLDSLDDLFSENVKVEVLKAVEDVRKEIRGAIREARAAIREAIDEAPAEVRDVLRGLDIEALVEEVAKKAPAFVRDVLKEVDVEKTARDALRRFKEEAVDLEKHLRDGLGEDVESELREALEEAEEEVREAIEEARGEIEEAVEEAPEEVRRVLRDLDIARMVEEGARKAPELIRRSMKEIEAERTAREEVLRKLEPDSAGELEDHTHEDLSGAPHPEDRRGDTRKLQRRVDELEGAIETLLKEIESLRREIENSRP